MLRGWVWVKESDGLGEEIVYMNVGAEASK